MVAPQMNCEQFRSHPATSTTPRDRPLSCRAARGCSVPPPSKTASPAGCAASRVDGSRRNMPCSPVPPTLAPLGPVRRAGTLGALRRFRGSLAAHCEPSRTLARLESAASPSTAMSSRPMGAPAPPPSPGPMLRSTKRYCGRSARPAKPARKTPSRTFPSGRPSQPSPSASGQVLPRTRCSSISATKKTPRLALISISSSPNPAASWKCRARQRAQPTPAPNLMLSSTSQCRASVNSSPPKKPPSQH